VGSLRLLCHAGSPALPVLVSNYFTTTSIIHLRTAVRVPRWWKISCTSEPGQKALFFLSHSLIPAIKKCCCSAVALTGVTKHTKRFHVPSEGPVESLLSSALLHSTNFQLGFQQLAPTPTANPNKNLRIFTNLVGHPGAGWGGGSGPLDPLASAAPESTYWLRYAYAHNQYRNWFFWHLATLWFNINFIF